jgi:hypothetical protein
MNQIEAAEKLLRYGPKGLPSLERCLKAMSRANRIAFAKLVQEKDIPAPQIVFYDYDAQEWLIQ